MPGLPSFKELIKELTINGVPCNQKIHEMASLISTFLEMGSSSVIIEGGYGDGKTTLAYFLLLKYMPENNKYPVYIDLARLLKDRKYKMKIIGNVVKYWKDKGYSCAIKTLKSFSDHDIRFQDHTNLRDMILQIYEKIKGISECDDVVLIIDEMERPRKYPDIYGYRSSEEYFEDLFNLINMLDEEQISTILLITPYLHDDLKKSGDVQLLRRLEPSHPLITTVDDVKSFLQCYTSVHGIQVSDTYYNIAFDILGIERIDIAKNVLISITLSQRNGIKILDDRKLSNLIVRNINYAFRVSDSALLARYGTRTKVSDAKKRLSAILLLYAALHGSLRYQVSLNELEDFINKINDKIIPRATTKCVTSLDYRREYVEEKAREAEFIEFKTRSDIGFVDKYVELLEKILGEIPPQTPIEDDTLFTIFAVK